MKAPNLPSFFKSPKLKEFQFHARYYLKKEKKYQVDFPAHESSTGWSALLGATTSDIPYLTQVNISWVKQHGLITTRTLQWLS